MRERRYSDEEVRRIFDAASEARGLARQGDGSGDGGLTLSDLQEIGREVGMSPDRIAQAARSLDTPAAKLPSRRLLGMPLSVGHVVELPRAPTDGEWATLVGEMREVFRARGRLGGSGGFREWSNSNLHALVEPTADGARLRFGTLKGGAAGMTWIGFGLAAFTVIMLVLSMIVPGVLLAPWVPLYGLGGAILAGSSLLRLPRWAREREEQFRWLGERAQALLGEGGSARTEPPSD
jgi:hypothetical protein